MGKGSGSDINDVTPKPLRRRRHGKPDRPSNGETIMRYLGYTLGDDSVPMPPPSPEMMQEMGTFVEEATKAGVLLATGGLGPSAEGTKVRYSNGEFTVTDGPFTEAKELIGGWALMEVRDKDEAIEWTKRFLTVVGGGESTVRQVF
jgi:hypothetical protein